MIRRKLVLLLLISLAQLPVICAQGQSSLADAARQAREAQSSPTRKPVKMFSDDDENTRNVRKRPDQPLDADARAFCDRLKAHHDPGAANDCTVLKIDMGQDYVTTVSRLAELKKQLCSGSTSGDPSLNGERRQLEEQFSIFKAREKQALDLAQADYRQTEEKEMSEIVDLNRAKGYGLGSASDLAKSPYPEARELNAKYTILLKQKQDAIEKEKTRSLRVFTDDLRFKDTCY